MDNKRAAYIEKLQSELLKASNSKKFVESEEGSYVISYIQELVTAKTNSLLKVGLTHEENISLKAEINILRKLKAVLEAQASDTQIKELNDALTLAVSGEQV